MQCAYTVTEFCSSHRISRSQLYKLWAAGQGPHFKRIGTTKRIITAEQAAEWRQRDDNAPSKAEGPRPTP
jgi:hypothetical protein